jgi:tRNA threonylcarbamoyladenosine biosynthesis protein TsaB
MALILSLETSVDTCSVAIQNKGNVLASAIVTEPQAHASKLALLIEQVLKESNTSPQVLNAVAVASGPGSYTGLRIGVSTAKGLCYSLDIPLIAVNTLELLAYQVISVALQDSLLCPMIDARRMEVYSMLADSRLKVLQAIKPEIIDEQSYSHMLLDNKIIFFGNGAAKCKGVITHPNALFIDDVIPSAVSLGEIASRKFEKEEFEDLIHFEPLYLKEFQIKKSTKPLF